MMKKLIVLSLLALLVTVSVTFAEEPLVITVTTNSASTILPSRLKQTALAWTQSTAFAQGDYCENYDRIYMAIVAGTTSNNPAYNGPSHLSGAQDDWDGSVQWYRVPSGLRKGFIICNNGSNTVALAVGASAQMGKGALLPAGASWSSAGEIQEEVTVISSIINDHEVTAVEW
jgi:hypothetical protein